MEWISVKEKLPEDHADCIVYGIPTCGSCGEYARVVQARFRKERFEFGEYDCGIETTHWMPLPEPPKEKI